MATVTDDGTDFDGHGGVDWNDHSYAECADCCAHGPLSRFRDSGGAAPPPPAVAQVDPTALLRQLLETGLAAFNRMACNPDATAILADAFGKRHRNAAIEWRAAARAAIANTKGGAI